MIFPWFIFVQILMSVLNKGVHTLLDQSVRTRLDSSSATAGLVSDFPEMAALVKVYT